MDYLAGVQALHREAKLPGAAPDAVTGQTGRAADLVAWYAQAWNDIQIERDGHWKWLRRAFTVNTVADDQDYAFGAVTDVATAVAITRFRSWYLDPNEPPLIYLVSDGQATEHELVIQRWDEYRFNYRRATHTAAPPVHVTEDPAGVLFLGPKPDGIYTVTGNYWASNQVLAADDDTPEMPADYHMTIVYRALVKYGYNAVAREVLSRAGLELPAMYDALVLNQAWSRFSLTTAGPLA